MILLSGGLKDGESDFDNAVDFDKADVTVEYRYPLGNNTARADLQRNTLELERVEKQIEDVALSLESEARAMLTQLRELEDVLALNKEQVQTAADKTAAEEELYEAGAQSTQFCDPEPRS